MCVCLFVLIKNVKCTNFRLGAALFEGDGALELGLACIADFKKNNEIPFPDPRGPLLIDSKILPLIDSHKVKLQYKRNSRQ